MLDLFIATANAQEAAAAAAPQSPLMQFVPLAVVFGIFYFMMIKPQQKKLKRNKQCLLLYLKVMKFTQSLESLEKSTD